MIHHQKIGYNHADMRNGILKLTWLKWYVWLGALGIGVGLTCLSTVLLMSARQPSTVYAPATAQLMVTPAVTASLAPALVEQTPTLPIPPSPVPGVISISAYVQISGTGGIGLRLRAEPSLTATVRLLGSEAEIFLVEEGPVEQDGYTWWYLVGPFDNTRAGWAVANFLIVVQGP
jgi:hypothetical protein